MRSATLVLCPLLTLTSACDAERHTDVEQSTAVDDCDTPRPFEGDLVISGENFNDLLPHALAYGDMGEFCRHYNQVNGDLVLAWSDVRDLDPLDCLCEVGGSVDLYINFQLESIEGLSNLRRVGQSVNIAGTEALTSLHGLEGLTDLDGDLGLYSNWGLNDLRGLDNLESVGGEIFLSDSGYQSLTGLEALERAGAFYAGYNADLTDLHGLMSLREVEGPMTLRFNDSLLDLSGARALERVGGLIVYANPALADLSGAEALTRVEGDLALFENPAMTSVEGLQALSRVEGELRLEINDQLTQLDALHSLEHVSGDLLILDNPTLPWSEVETLLDALGEDAVCGDITCEGNGEEEGV